MIKSYFVYVMASKKDGVLYIGVTSDLKKRVFEHKEGIFGGFTKKYFVKKLVYFEQTPDIDSAILREKQLKKWKRDWKIRMIEDFNPQWNDLYNKIV